jgi:hypothetical protein
MRLGEQVRPSHLDCISSGCLSLDVALGGGWARGRIVEVRACGGFVGVNWVSGRGCSAVSLGSLAEQTDSE